MQNSQSMYEAITIISIIVLTAVTKVLFKNNKIVFSNRAPLLAAKLIAFTAGILLIFLNLSEFNAYKIRQSWTKVMGEVVAFEIVGIKTKEPEISYRFMANNSQYLAKTNLQTALFGSRKYQEQTARTISGNYQVGDSVMVYYNPGNPKESRLKITPGWSTYMQHTFGIFLVAIILALITPKKATTTKDSNEFES